MGHRVRRSDLTWRIYYADGSVVSGRSGGEWRSAPDDGVQVVALLTPADRTAGWTYEAADGSVVRVVDRELWTGQGRYDPFGWGEKTGTLIDDDAYMAIWARACSEGF